MIYCVVPRELEGELFDKLVEHYRDNPNVEVIVDRRSAARRDNSDIDDETRERRQVRDRRRARPGTFPTVDLPESSDV